MNTPDERAALARVATEVFQLHVGSILDLMVWARAVELRATNPHWYLTNAGVDLTLSLNPGAPLPNTIEFCRRCGDDVGPDLAELTGRGGKPVFCARCSHLRGDW